MENATKALLIGAGLLFAIIIITIAFISYQNISGFYQQKQNNLTEEQLSAFNTEYGAYERDLTGFELVGLINKIADFNQRKPEEEGYSLMSISVEITDASNFNGKLFQKGTFTYTGKNGDSSTLIGKIEEMQKLEETYSASVLSKLVASRVYENLKEYNNGVGEKTIKDIIGKNLSSYPTKTELEKYEDYIAFKRAKFAYVSNSYTNGQITKLNYKSK